MTETVSWACDALWENIIITSSIKLSSEPSVANLIAYIVRDPQISEDIKSLGLCTFQMIVRPDHLEDQQVVDKLRSAVEVSGSTVSREQANAALSSVSNSVSQFLSMYEEEDESDSESSEEIDPVQEFECVLCRCGPSTEKDMFPCMLCHMNSNAAWSKT